jgi:hypothetical protein
VSNGPPGSTWARPPAAGPRNANSTRSGHFRDLLHGRAFAYSLVLGAVATLVAGAALHSLALLAGGPIAVAAVAVAIAFSSADERAEHDFFGDYAATRNFAYVGDMALMPLTPLLGAGDRRRCEHWMQGHLEGGLGCGLGHYTYQVHVSNSRGQRRLRETRHFTVCVADLEAGLSMFPGVFLCRRRGVFGRLDGEDWLSHRNRHKIALESASLCDRYDLWVDDAQDELLFRELFVPSFEVLLAEHPFEPCFEYRAGTLVVYVERLLEDEGHLDWLREVSAHIAGRFAGEIREREQLGAA